MLAPWIVVCCSTASSLSIAGRATSRTTLRRAAASGAKTLPAALTRRYRVASGMSSRIDRGEGVGAMVWVPGP